MSAANAPYDKDGYRLRYRLGRWLLRPFVGRLHRHYSQAAKDAARVGDQRRAENCNYICIGLDHAVNRKRV